jgi:formylglycine-generating enzyme required for sulfatase activity
MVKRLFGTGLFLATVFAFLLLARRDRLTAQDSATSGRKLAFLVGVRTYRHSELKDLAYPENDVEDLNKLLNRQGFTVTLLTTRAKPDQEQFPTSENIRRYFADVLSGASKHDLLVVGLAGHGLQPSGSSQSYFCPYDANPSERDGKPVQPESLISINDILRQLGESGIGQKLLLVDACRNDPQVPGSRRGGGVMQLDLATLPQQTGVLMSCDEGEFSFESEKFGNGHGAFFYEVIQGLRGAARDDEGVVTWESLGSFVRKRVPAEVHAIFGQNSQQNPNAINNLVGAPIALARVETTPVEAPGTSAGTAAANGQAPVPNVRKEQEHTPAAQTGDRPGLLIAPFNAQQAIAARETWAGFSKLRTEFNNSVEMRLVLIPPGQFAMGIEPGAGEVIQTLQLQAPDEIGYETRHIVRITKPFYMGAFEVTKAQFEKFVNDAHYKTGAETNHRGGWGFVAREKKLGPRRNYNWRSWGVSESDDSPVVNVSWNDVSRFCEWLGSKEGKHYRLPTEAEWEYACRAGTTSVYYNGNNPQELARIGNVGDATGRAMFSTNAAWANAIGSSDGWAFTAPVGKFLPNNFGLFDMTGNVTEWCQDWFDPLYYANSPPNDPTGPPVGLSRVIRGGGWTANPIQCRSAARWYGPPDDYLCDTGFRVVLVP